MTTRQVLREALEVVRRAHTATQLAEDARGHKINPRSPKAVAWGTVGALIKVAPRYPNRTGDNATPGHLDVAWDAFLLLEAAAFDQGHRYYGGPTVTGSTVVCDRAGLPAVIAMFQKALNMAPPEPERRAPSPARGTGNQPRGTEAIA